jgi:hypothetical protein
MFALKKNEGFDVLLKMICDSNKTETDTDTNSVPNDYSKDIEKILSSLKLTMKNWKTDTGMYSMIKYDKQAYGLIQDDYNTIGLLRSIVVNDEGKIVAFSPPKSLVLTKEREDHFNKNNIMSPMEDDDDKIINTNEWYAEEFVEGTMINLFYSEKGKAWEIATKSTVGGNVTFFSPKNPKENIEVRDRDTFRNMFFETCTKLGFKYENLPKEFMYSFVLQHPKNRIVLPINEAAIYIVGVYSVNQDTLEVLQLSAKGVVDKYCDNHVLRPKALSCDDYTVSGLKNEYASMNSSFDIMGVVFNNMITGDRMKIRNPNYEMVKNMKGNEQKLQLQYLTLRHGGRIADYLKCYPEYKSDFSVFRAQVHAFTSGLHQNYINCYIYKKSKFDEFPKQYKKHMFTLHKRYIEELREVKGSVTYEYVIVYVNSLLPADLLYSLNYVIMEHKKKIKRIEEPVIDDTSSSQCGEV